MTKTHEEMRVELIKRAAADEGFRARLIDDPKAAIKEALGIEVPDSLSITVHQENAATGHLVLPPDAKLTSADLQAAAGGHEWKTPAYGRDVPHSHPRYPD